MPIYRVIYEHMHMYQIDVKADNEDKAMDAVESVFKYFQPYESSHGDQKYNRSGMKAIQMHQK